MFHAISPRPRGVATCMPLRTCVPEKWQNNKIEGIKLFSFLELIWTLVFDLRGLWSRDLLFQMAYCYSNRLDNEVN